MPSNYDPDTKGKAVHLVTEHRDDYPSGVGRDHRGVRPVGDEPVCQAGERHLR